MQVERHRIPEKVFEPSTSAREKMNCEEYKRSQESKAVFRRRRLLTVLRENRETK